MAVESTRAVPFAESTVMPPYQTPVESCRRENPVPDRYTIPVECARLVVASQPCPRLCEVQMSKVRFPTERSVSRTWNPASVRRFMDVWIIMSDPAGSRSQKKKSKG